MDTTKWVVGLSVNDVLTYENGKETLDTIKERWDKLEFTKELSDDDAIHLALKFEQLAAIAMNGAEFGVNFGENEELYSTVLFPMLRYTFKEYGDRFDVLEFVRCAVNTFDYVSTRKAVEESGADNGDIDAYTCKIVSDAIIERFKIEGEPTEEALDEIKNKMLENITKIWIKETWQ